MGKFIFLCILASVGYFGYNKFTNNKTGSSEVAAIYALFADAMARNHFDEAKSFAREQALTSVEAEESKMTSNLVINPYAGAKDAANAARNEAGLKPLEDKSVTGVSLMDQIAGPITNTKFEVTSERFSGKVSSLEVKGSICRQQPGCMGIRCTHCTQSQHKAEMCKSATGWNVCSYSIAQPQN